MTARPVGRCRVETVHPTKALLAEDGALGMAVHPITESKEVSANRIEDISSQSLRQTLAPPILLAFHGWRIGVFDLYPMRRAPGAIG